jgi:hypothetical protein
MTEDHFMPDFDIDADYAIGVIDAMFDVDPQSDHGPNSFACLVCADWHRLVLEQIASGAPPFEIAAWLSLTIPEGHPTEDCIACEGCRFEQQYAIDLIKEVTS